MKKMLIIASVVGATSMVLIVVLVAINLFGTNIKIISPKSGQKVSLANDTIYNWSKNYSSLEAAAAMYMGQGDLYFPNSVLLEWSAKEDASKYTVKYSLNKDMSNATVLETEETQLQIEGLLVATTYYWQVEAIYAEKTKKSKISSFTTEQTPRAVYIDCVSNTRDLGGYKTADKKRIKQGMIYRGAYLDGISPAGIDQALNMYKIKTDLDLRLTGEGTTGDGSALGKSVNYVNINTTYYTHIFEAENQENIKNAVKIFADKDNYPIYMHCTLGRDRTGTLAFILGALLGMDKEQLFMDYDMSCFSIMGTSDGQSFSGMRSTFQGLYTRMNAYSNGDLQANTEQYLLDIGVTEEEISAIREILLYDAG